MTNGQPPPTFGSWVQSRLGFVFGRDGKGGSAVCVQLKDGADALLTARHVVIDSLLTGAMTVARVGDKETFIPKRIRISSRTDAALITAGNPVPWSEKVSFAEWTTPSSDTPAGLIVFPCGFPGRWKVIDIENKAIPSMKALIYGTKLSDPPRKGGLLVCDIDENEPGMLPTFEGMSGGPMFSKDGIFLGILDHQIRRIGGGDHGEVHVSPVEELTELHTPFVAPLSDYTRQEAWAPVLNLVNKDDRTHTVQLELRADMYWSVSQPESKCGRFGRIQMIRFLSPDGETQYPINTESVFYPKDDTPKERERALDEEVRFLLDRTGWGIDPSTPTI